MKALIKYFYDAVQTEEDIELLKQKILELAFRGQLVPHDPNDEPASELLKRVEEEKQKLIKEKKIKKQNDLTPINSEEIPYKLPSGWTWVKLGDIGDWGAGATPQRSNPKYYNGNIPWLKTGELNDGYISDSEEKITELALRETSVRLNKPGDVLIAMYGATIGKLGILEIEATTNQACCACTPFTGIYNRFLFYYLLSQRNVFRSQGAGGAQPNISKTKIINTLMPLPPYNEQKRIVAKIDELMIMCNQLSKYIRKKEDSATSFNKSVFTRIQDPANSEVYEDIRFVIEHMDDLLQTKEDVGLFRNSILSLAIRGQLVSQDPNDEPASELLKRIEEEKQKLIQEGKIKKQNSFSSIKDEEIPYELPYGWEWVRIGDIAQINPRNSISDDLPVSFIPMKLIDDGYKNNHSSEVKLWGEIKQGFTHFQENDIVIAKITPCFENRKSAILRNLKNGYGAGTTELHVIRPYIDHVLNRYLLILFKTEDFIKKGISTYTGTAGQQRIKKDFIQNFVIGLPPYEEQKRIVEKVDQLMKLCDQLEQQIEQSEKDRELLMQSILQEVLSSEEEKATVL